MVEVPLPTMVTVFPSIVATVGSELVYVIAPSLLDVGATRLKAASPIFFEPTTNRVSAGVPRFTVRVVVIEPDKKLAVLA